MPIRKMVAAYAHACSWWNGLKVVLDNSEFPGSLMSSISGTLVSYIYMHDEAEMMLVFGETEKSIIKVAN